jgi:uncharacterized protein YuzE
MACCDSVFRPKIKPTTMKKRTIKFEYDPDVDAAYLTLTRARISESEEVRPGIVVDLDASDQIVGIEILRFTRRFRASAGAIKPVRAVEREPTKRRAAG